jgi:hypothetical protein
LKLRQQQSQRIEDANKKITVIPIPAATKSFSSSPDLFMGVPSATNQIKRMTTKATIRISHPSKSPRKPVNDFFQMLLGSSFINLTANFR